MKEHEGHEDQKRSAFFFMNFTSFMAFMSAFGAAGSGRPVDGHNLLY
jgi:hypothetical protein